MEIFGLPLDTTHLHRQLKWLSYIKNTKYLTYSRQVNMILDGELGKVWQRRRIIHRLLQKYGINDQRSAQWHAKRSEMITASEITKAFASATPATRREIMLKKIEGAKPGDGTMNSACAHGTRFEPVAKFIYCQMQGGGEIIDTSCVVHPDHSFIGASPDGIYFAQRRDDPRWGKLIEIKCPVSRKFDQTTPIPKEYYHQMQLQMECTNLDVCDYVEMQFATFTQTEWGLQTGRKGRFAVFDDGHTEYDWDNSPTWKTFIRSFEDTRGLYRIYHWALVNHRIATVNRDYTWMSTHFADLKNFWDEVLHHRANGTIPPKIETIDDRGLEIDLSGARLVSQPEVCANPVVSCDSSSVSRKNASTLAFSDL